MPHNGHEALLQSSSRYNIHDSLAELACCERNRCYLFPAIHPYNQHPIQAFVQFLCTLVMAPWFSSSLNDNMLFFIIPISECSYWYDMRTYHSSWVFSFEKVKIFLSFIQVHGAFNIHIYYGYAWTNGHSFSLISILQLMIPMSMSISMEKGRLRDLRFV